MSWGLKNIKQILNENKRKTWSLYNKKEYKECIKICNKNIKIIRRNKLIEEYKDYFYSAYYMKAKCYKQTNRIKKAIQMINIAFKYCDNKLYRIDTFWLLAECMMVKNKKKQGLKLYNKCIIYYESVLPFAKENDNCLKCLVGLMTNKALILNNKEIAQETINIYLHKHLEQINYNVLNMLQTNLKEIKNNKC